MQKKTFKEYSQLFFCQLLLFSTFFCTFILYSHTPHAHAKTSQAELTISAASSLTDVFTELAEAFKKQYSVTIYLNFGASSTLLKQIMGSVPTDIFASADQTNMERAIQNNLIDKSSVKDFTQNAVVLIVPITSKEIPNNVYDLLAPTYKTIAIAQTNAVPIGIYAKASLKHENLWEALKDRMVYASNVRAILAYVSRGEADAGFVYKTDALIAKEYVHEACTLQGHDPVLYPIGILTDSPNKKEAQAFIDFIFTDTGKAILEKFGFTPI